LPSGVWKAAAVHLAAVALGIGILPLVLGIAWALGAVARPGGKQAHALAVVVLACVAALSLQAASYDLRFGGAELVRDRYLFYVAPLLLIAAVAALLDARPRLLLVVGAAVAFAWTVRWYDFHVVEPFTVDSPVSILNERIVDYAGDLSPATFVGLATLLLVAAVAAARSLVPRRVVAGVFLAYVLAAGALTASDAFGRVLASTGPSGRTLESTPGDDESWVDRALPDGAGAGIVPYPIHASWGASAVLWWDVEFWNRSVQRTWVADGTFAYAPFPVDEVGIDAVRGRVRTPSDGPAYMVVATQDTRFRLSGPRLAAQEGLELLEVERPYRLEWATRGLDVDGWVRPGRPATVRVFARPEAPAQVAMLDVVLKAPPTESVSYRLSSESGSRAASAASDAAVLERLELCVPAGGYADARVDAETAAVIPGPALGPVPSPPRRVGVRVESITLAWDGRSCAA
jgi:hypothetical protein